MPAKIRHNSPRPRKLLECLRPDTGHRRFLDWRPSTRINKRKPSKQVQRNAKVSTPRKGFRESPLPQIEPASIRKQSDSSALGTNRSFGGGSTGYVPVEVWQNILRSDKLSHDDLRNISLVSKEALSAATSLLFSTIDLQMPHIVQLARHPILSQLPQIAHVTIYDDDYALGWDPKSKTLLPCRETAAEELSKFCNLKEIVMRYPQQGPNSKGETPRGRGCAFWNEVVSKANMPKVKKLRLYGALTGMPGAYSFFHDYQPSDAFLTGLTSLELSTISVLSEADFRISQVFASMPNLRELKIRNCRPDGFAAENSIRWPAVFILNHRRIQLRLRHLVLENVLVYGRDLFNMLSDTLETVSVTGVLLWQGEWSTILARLKALARRSLRTISLRHLVYHLEEYPEDMFFVTNAGCVTFTWTIFTHSIEDCIALGNLVREADRQEAHGKKMTLNFEHELYRGFSADSPSKARRTACGMIAQGAYPWATDFSTRVVQIYTASQWEWSSADQRWYQPVPDDLDGMEEPSRGVSSGELWPWLPQELKADQMKRKRITMRGGEQGDKKLKPSE